MKIAIKIIWIIAIIVVFTSMIWFLFCSTAFFKREIDLVTTFIYVWVGVPALLFVGVSILCLIKGWIPNYVVTQIVLFLVITILSVIFSTTFIQNANVKGWLAEIVYSDYIQITSDGKYEYQIEFINLFQKNSYAQLQINDMITGEMIKIPIDINTSEIHALGDIPKEPKKSPPLPSWVWSEMSSSDGRNIYILNTTTYLKKTIEKFEVDMERKISRRIE